MKPTEPPLNLPLDTTTTVQVEWIISLPYDWVDRFKVNDCNEGPEELGKSAATILQILRVNFISTTTPPDFRDLTTTSISSIVMSEPRLKPREQASGYNRPDSSCLTEGWLST